MIPKWRFLFLLAAAMLLLASCGKSLEEKADDGLAAARSSFEEKGKKATEEIEGIKLYKPVGYVVEDSSDPQNIILTKKDETFILFINPNEGKNSHFFYDLMKSQEKGEIVKEEMFTGKDDFGFASILDAGDGKVELITSIGGVKMSTITKEKNIPGHMASMMEIVRSVEQE